VQQAHTSEWLGTFGAAGNGDIWAELAQACEQIKTYLQAHQLNPSQALARLDGGAGDVDATAFGAKRVHAVAGIGDPARFFGHLEMLGLEVLPHAFADHHAFRPSDLEFGDDMPVVMTEKDAVKCARFAQSRFWVLPVRAEVDAGLGAIVLDKLRSPDCADKLRRITRSTAN